MSFRNTKTPLKPTKEAKWQVPMRPHPGMGMKEYYLKGELKERFCKLFPKNSNHRMMTWFGIGFSTLQRFKREFGLEKDMKSIIRQRQRTRRGFASATAIMPPCEARNPQKLPLKAHESSVPQASTR